MKKIIIFLQIVIALTLANCGGYESIYSSKTSNFNISSIEIDNNNKINLKIKNSLRRFSNPDSEKEIAVKISSEKNIITTSKDSKGNPKTFSMNIKLNLELNLFLNFASSKRYIPGPIDISVILRLLTNVSILYLV